jgi:D,D-heptose 1,7-bisphosphate phosphatase
MNIVIMAGGKGTRISALYPDLPKPMIPLCGEPLLAHQIELCVSQGFNDITIITGHMGEVIREGIGNGASFGANISYVRENTPLGTGGALALLPKEDILVLFGDVYMQTDLNRFVNFHEEHGADVTLFAHPNSHPADSDVIVCDGDSRVTDWARKNKPRAKDLRNLVNAGIYVLSAGALPCGEAKRIDLDKDIIVPLIKDGRVFAYRSSEYVKDMGTPERLVSVTKDIESGAAAAKMLKNKQRAVFFDRDGTLNELDGLVSRPEQLALIDGAAAAVALVNKSPYLAICVTNQSVIARGLVTSSGLEEIHGRLDNLLAEQGAYLDDLLYCPHHPDVGYPEEIPEYKIKCDCRKPAPGLLLEAAKRCNIDLSASWMIGDSAADMASGRAAGCATIGVLTGEALGKSLFDSDRVCASVLDAVKWILFQ